MPRHASTQRDHHRCTVPVSSRAVDFPAGHIRPLHHHSAAQLIYAVDGVMVISSEAGQWIVPPTQAIWMPAYMAHTVRMVNAVTMRTLYIQPDAASGLPDRCHTVAISDLLRQLILSAMNITGEYTADSRDGRLMGLLLDELNFLPVLPLHLPLPTHPYLAEICKQIRDAPDDKRTLREWAQVVGVDPKTVQRTFAQQVGMTFGQWRQQARLLMALERLATGQSVLDVALSMGYDSPSAFTAMFKKQLGVVPSEYFRLSE
ncbi:AraC family transcriptional regulator [Paraburkholderia guartelaensis]|uniref:AraC family transcriptional regulator n=1 Tax=Paraburkholderia guartelaensis TaxID=2546446 RepID=A0A4R5LJU4_9BURK|nr:helix-turn-helix transcriptional regulator [Paraburkholderia guartelaensis]TDG09804.1 AraC family transcriptional regulator [Paraburkholderia guartelaensis]